MQPKSRVEQEKAKPFEEWWESDFHSSFDKENRTPNQLRTTQSKNDLSKRTFDANFAQQWESVSNTNSNQQKQEDWLNLNPFVSKGQNLPLSNVNFFDF